MIFSYNWLQEYTKDKLPAAQKLADLLSLHAFEVEEVKKAGKDWLLTIDVLPNRAHDCLNHIGMAREIAAITGKKIQEPKSKEVKVQKGKLVKLEVRVDNATLVPRYAALVIEGITPGASPQKVQQYLSAVGVNSINNIVDLTNFIMLEMGQPLHAFDYDQIQGHTMHVRASKKGEVMDTLDRERLSLPEGVLVIEDVNDIIDLVGIKGGKNSGISQNTKNIVLQAANFNASGIYQARQKLKYTTQAADIYAHGIDPNLGMQALECACTLLAEWGIGGRVVQFVDLYPKKVQQKRITLHHAFVESLLGIEVPKQTIHTTLQNLGCEVQEQKSGTFLVTVPTRRLDIAIPEDLVEEIGRIYGYQNIPAKLPVAPIMPPARNTNLFWAEKIRNALQQLGCTEIYNYSFIGKKYLETFSYTDSHIRNLIELENPISEDFMYMRDSLLEHLLHNVYANQKKFSQARMFEIGTVFSKKHKKLEETTMIGVVLLGDDFYAAKGVVDFLLQSVGISNVWYDEYQATPEHSRSILWHAGKSAEIKVGNGKEIGFVGEISPAVLQSLKITKPVAALHMNMAMIQQLATEEIEYATPVKFPAVTRDIAVLVPVGTKVAELMNAMHEVGHELIADIDVFDIYIGDKVSEGQKSIAFHIVYQSPERTLTGKEVDIVHENIIKRIEENPLWEVRM